MERLILLLIPQLILEILNKISFIFIYVGLLEGECLLMKKNNRIFPLLKKNLISQKGMALLATLIFVFILTSFGIALLTMTRNDIKLSTLQEESTKAFYLADAGVERAINWLEKQETPPLAKDIPPVNFDRNHTFDELNTGKYTVFLSIDDNPASTVAGYIIETEGWITRADDSRVSRKIKTMVMITNFAEYAYFSNLELFPDNSNISGSGSYVGQKIWFIGDDIFGGKVHSNSQFHIVGEPNFYGEVTSTENTIDFWGDAYHPNGDNFPGFHNDYALGVSNIPLPQYRKISDLDDEKSLQRIAGGSLGKSGIQALPSNDVYVPSAGGMDTEVTGGIYVKGDVTSINLDVDNADDPNSKITFVQGGNTTTITSVLSPITLSTESTLNTITVPAGTTIPANTTLVKEGTNTYTSYEGITNGLLFIDGSINSLYGNNHRGKMSIASTESINITNNIYYYDRDTSKSLFEDDIEGIEDSLGLIAANDVKIVSGPSDPQNIEIDAIIMALSTSFFYSGWQSTLKGTLSLLGGLIQKQRGPVGTHNAGVKVSGYSKNYQYDTRMANPAGGNLPPYFPSTGQYQKVYWKEVY
jgi:hypothetical protein